MSFLQKLMAKWQLKSIGQVIMVLVVFALTGSTVLLIKKPIVAYFSTDGEQSVWFTILYFLLILPLYNIILLCYGALLGQFSFFWGYEKKTFARISGLFKKKSSIEDNPA